MWPEGNERSEINTPEDRSDIDQIQQKLDEARADLARAAEVLRHEGHDRVEYNTEAQQSEIDRLQQELDTARAEIARLRDVLYLLWGEHYTDGEGNVIGIEPIDPDLSTEIKKILAEGREPWLDASDQNMVK